MNDDEKLQAARAVHPLPLGIQPIHKSYGLWIVSAGSNKAPVDGFFKTAERYFEYFSISHMHGGRGRLWVHPDRESEIRPGQCVIISPGTVNRYGGAGGCQYEEDNVCFSGVVAEMMRRTGIISDGVFEFGKTRLLLHFQKLAYDPATDSQIEANIMLQKILTDVYLENRRLRSGASSESYRIELLLNLLKEQVGKWWSVAEMAEYCTLSTDQFRRVFEKHTGMLPKVYADRLKLSKAAELLVSSKMRVADIAQMLNYRDCYHFSRRFKQLMGLSPKQYRWSFGAR